MKAKRLVAMLQEAPQLFRIVHQGYSISPRSWCKTGGGWSETVLPSSTNIVRIFELTSLSAHHSPKSSGIMTSIRFGTGCPVYHPSTDAVPSTSDCPNENSPRSVANTRDMKPSLAYLSSMTEEIRDLGVMTEQRDGTKAFLREVT